MGMCKCLLVCLAVVISTGYALDCYVCESDKVDGCLKDAKPRSQYCHAGYNLDPVCYYMLAYDDNRKTMTVKSGCEKSLSHNPFSIDTVEYACKSSPGVYIRECRVCQTDFCNSASSLTAQFLTFSFASCVFFFTKFLTF